MTGPWYWNPEWWQVILIVAGTAIAASAFLAERRAVRLTQRADILFDGTDFNPRVKFIFEETIITLTFKNYGPTRANNVRVTVDLSSHGVVKKPAGPDPGIPPVVVGAGEQFPVSFPMLGNLFESETIGLMSKGDIPLRFVATIVYEDVFGKTHRTENSGVYYGHRGPGFLIEEHNAD